MKRTLIASALGSLLLVGACATATPYQSAANTDRGYIDQQIENDRWSVSFSGNSLTDRRTVETYLLYRAAELTVQEGFDYFRVVQRQTDEDTRLLPTGPAVGLSPYYRGFHCNYAFYGAYGGRLRRGYVSAYDPYGFGFGAPDYREITRYEATAEIMMGRGAPPEDADVFTAREVLQNLGTQIVRPETTA